MKYDLMIIDELYDETYTLNTFYNDCERFNREAGKLTVATAQDLRDQLQLIHSEFNELQEELILNPQANTQNLLKEYIDLMVTVVGFGQMLESNGFNLVKGLEKVAQNNLEKFVPASEVGAINEALQQATIKMYRDKGVRVTAKYSRDLDAFVFLDENNKVRKPFGYEQPDLSDCLPEYH